MQFGPAGKSNHVAFDATAPINNVIIDDGTALVEGDVVGKHIGEFAGIPATGKNFRVPICVVYDLEHDQNQAGADLL